MNPSKKITIPANPEYLHKARNALKKFLACRNFPKETVYKLILCLDEACSNIIKHSYKGETEEPIEISFCFEGDELIIKVRDYGKQCDVSEIKPRPLDDIKPGGLGTHCICKIMDRVDYCTEFEEGTLLTMSKNLASEGQ